MSVIKCQCGRYSYNDYRCSQCEALRDYGIKYDYKKEVIDAILKYQIIDHNEKNQHHLKYIYDKQVISEINKKEKRERDKELRKTYCFFKEKSFYRVLELLEWYEYKLYKWTDRQYLYQQAHKKVCNGISAKLTMLRRRIRECSNFVNTNKCLKGCCGILRNFNKEIVYSLN